MSFAPADATPAMVLEHAQWALKDRRRAQLDELDLVLIWADLHGGEPATEVPGGDRLVSFGGDGTPAVRELSLAELAIARSEHVFATRSLMADLLDLRHRLPLLNAALRRLDIEVWVGRKVATMSRKLDKEAVRLVDRAVSNAIGQAPSRLLAIAEAKIIEADIATRADDLANAKSRKGVWISGERDESEGAGLRGFFARVEAADAIWADSTVQRVADVLAADVALRMAHHPELGPNPSMDELRAAAFSWLARPHDLAELLGVIDSAPKAPAQQATVFVHLHETALSGLDTVARSERLGPLLRDQMITYLGHANVTVKPVIDLNTSVSVNGYEHPEAVKQRTELRTVGDVFPHASGINVRLDHDHVVPYDPGGPPGQTGDHNDAPLSRPAHRAKTHLGYRVHQLGPNSYLWSTPNGLHRLVNSTGTHHVTSEDAEFLLRIHGLDSYVLAA